MRMRYLGITNPATTFARYRDARREWCELRLRCTPMSADYLAIDELIKALDATARHFTGEDDFYNGHAPAHTTP